MDYINAIARYYGFFSSYGTTNGKCRVDLAGKTNKKSVIAFFIIWFIILLFSMLNNKNITTSIIDFIAYIAIMSIILIKSKIIFNKLENKPTNLNIYERELPSNLRPAHVRMLLNDGLIDQVSLYATLLDLIDRGYIEIEKNKEIPNKKICEFQKENIVLSKTNKSQEKLFEFEKFTIKWLIDKYGKDGEVSSKEIYDKLNSNIYKEQPCKLFLEWQGLVLLSFPIRKYYKETNTTARFIYFLIMLLGFLLIQTPVGIFMIYYAFGNILYTSPLCVMNQIGIEEKDSWLDLKKYIEDFSNMQDRSIEMVKIWNFYLTYAVVLGIADVAEEEIKKFIGDAVYKKFEESVNNEEELKIIETRLKAFTNEEIKDKINKELEKY